MRSHRETALRISRAILAPPDPERCRRGVHGPLGEGEPRIDGDGVTVDLICVWCAVIVGAWSFTRDAWIGQLDRERSLDEAAASGQFCRAPNRHYWDRVGHLVWKCRRCGALTRTEHP